MPITTLVLVLLLLAVLVEAVLRRRGDRSGWNSFAGWVFAGFLCGFASISFAIGLLVLPFAVIAIVAVSRRPVWPGAVGLVGGAGLNGVLVAALNFGETGGPDYYSWLAVGTGMAVASVVGFVAAR